MTALVARKQTFRFLAPGEQMKVADLYCNLAVATFGSGAFVANPWSNPAFGGSATFAGCFPPAFQAQCKASGFTAIRQVVDPGPLLLAASNGPESVTTLFNSYIAPAIDQIITGPSAMKCIVDSHVRPFTSAQSTTLGLTDKEIVNAGPMFGSSGAAWTNYKTVMAQLGALLDARYGSVPNMVSFEVFNEPVTSTNGLLIGGTKWAAMAVDLVNTVRNSCPNLTLWVAGDGTATPGNYDYIAYVGGGLLTLNGKAFDGNVGFVNHQYSPAPFCFQTTAYTGASGWAYLSNIEFPPVAANLSSQITAATNAINADTTLTGAQQTSYIAAATAQLNAYYAVPATSYTDPSNNVTTTGMQGAVDKYHGQAAQWADSFGIARNRIWCGEFNANAGAANQPGNTPGLVPASETSLRAYYTMFTQSVLAHGASWGIWNLLAANTTGLTLAPGRTFVAGRRAALGLIEA